MVAVGRDYADVAPLRGVLTGGGGQRLEVTVTMVSPASVQVHSGPAPFGARPGASHQGQQARSSREEVPSNDGHRS